MQKSIKSLTLREACDQFPLEEKLLISGSLSIGRQLVIGLARQGTACANIRPHTACTLAAQVMGPALASAGLRLVTAAQELALVEQACSSAIEKGSYFYNLRSCAGFHDAMRSTVRELRRAGIGSSDVKPDQFEVPDKAISVASVLAAYEQLLKDNGFLDDAGLARLALSKLKAGASPLLAGSILLVIADADRSHAEQLLIETAAAKGRLFYLEIPDRRVLNLQPGQIALCHALGSENEVRAVLRRVVSEGIPLDQVEVLCASEHEYPPLIHELTQGHGIPATFSSGVPIIYSRPGRVVVAWLDWVTQGFPSVILRRMFASGLLSFSRVLTSENHPSSLFCARTIRDAGIGWGRQRYGPCIEALIAASQQEVAAMVREGDSDAEAIERKKGAMARAMDVRTIVEALIGATPDPTIEAITLPGLARAAMAFVRQFVAPVCEQDGEAIGALNTAFEELAILPEFQFAGPEPIERLREVVMGLRIQVSDPMPGSAHVSDFLRGGYSRRPHTFIVGLQQGCFGEGIQDPVLLDTERTRLNAGSEERRLKLFRSQPALNEERFWDCLARITGKVTLSFSCRDLVEDRQQFPSSAVLALHRAIAGDATANYEQLQAALGPPLGFAPQDELGLSDQEWWLKAAANYRKAEAIGGALKSVYPALFDGEIAERHRDSEQFTKYDGRIGNHASDLDPRLNGGGISSSRIEQLAKCGFAYFLKYVLRIEPPETERSPGEWLSAMELGTLVHEVFRRFMLQLQNDKAKPVFANHWPLLKSIAESQLAAQRSVVAAPNEVAYELQANQVMLTCQTFLKLEEAYCAKATPRYFEVSFGTPVAGEPGPLTTAEPVAVDVEGGKKFLLRGRIDRIDQLEDGSHAVWDYKTGSTYGFDEQSYVNGGRQIQHALYALAAQDLLKRNGLSATVSSSGYIFPGPKGEGERIVKTPDAPKTKAVLAELFDISAAGAFLHAKSEDFCKYCDYRRGCERPVPAFRRAAQKIQCDSAENAVLAPVRNLEEYAS